MPRVFITHEHIRINRETGEEEAAFDFTPARKYGELVFLASGQVDPTRDDILGLLDMFRDKLEDMNEDDYLLLAGSPILIGLATLAAGEVCDQLRFLQWAGRGQYKEVQVRCYED